MFSINTTTEYDLTVFDNTSSPYDNAFVEKVNLVISFSLIFGTFIAMMSLGCTMEVSRIKKHLIEPKGVAIAIVAQYGIMPLTAFCLAKLFHLGPLESITVLICGCCPGGNISNFFALALKGDINLSIVMTTCSTVLGFGLMPLMIYLYSQGFSNLESAVPYTSIIMSLVLILVPCGVGILINYYFPKYSKIITKVGLSILLIIYVVIGVVVGVIDENNVFRVIAPPLLATAALMPMIGFIFGYILSTLLKMNASCRRTIAMETGCQNIQLCTTILKVAFPAEVIGQLYLFPAVYIVFQVVEALFLVVLFRCYQMLRPSKQGGQGGAGWSGTQGDKDRAGRSVVAILDEAGDSEVAILGEEGDSEVAISDEAGDSKAAILDEAGDSETAILDGEGSSGVSILDEAGSSGVSILDEAGSSGVSILDEAGSSGVSILDEAGGSGVSIFDEAGSSGVSILDKAGSSGAAILDEQ